jgi:hypothetical protein
MNTKACTVQLKLTQENTVVTHDAIQKHIHIYTPILSTYAIYTTFKWVSHFLDNRYSSARAECVFGHRFGAILNRVFSFMRLSKSDGRLLKILIPA